MFGFPTRSRTLYKPGIRSREDLNNHSLSDRPLDQAISAFTPGAEITREGQIHTSVGFAAYELRGQKAVAVDPIGPKVELRR